MYNSFYGPANQLKGGDIVLVQGTGGVSIFGLQFAVASGATVIATSSSDEKLEIAKKLGAAHVVNYKRTPNWDEEVLKITGGRGVDHVLEIGGLGTIVKSTNCTRYGGSIHVIGVLAGVSEQSETVNVDGNTHLRFFGEQNADVNILPINVLLKAIILRGIRIGSRTQYVFMTSDTDRH